MIASYKLENGQVLEIEQDEDCQSPNDWDNGVIVLFQHRQCNIKHSKFHFEDACNYDILGYWKIDITAHIHSGVSLSRGITKGWDNSQGYMLIDQKMYPNLEEALPVADSILTEWNTWLAGDCTVMLVYDVKVCKCCKNESKELVSAVGGFYGSDPATNGTEAHLPAKIIEQLK